MWEGSKEPLPPATRSCLRTRKRMAMGRCPSSPRQQEPRKASRLQSPADRRKPSRFIPLRRNAASAISRSTTNGRRRSTPMRRSRRCSTSSSRSSRISPKGTVGTFCVRCHQQVGTQLGENARNAALGAQPDCARGCDLHHLPPGQGAIRQGQRRTPHRARQDLRARLRQRRKECSQRRPRQQGEILRQYQLPGAWYRHPQGMMTNDQMTKSEFCVSCHQVAVNLGIKLEIVWDQYRDSPARKAGVTCQDCHMGKVAGKPEGYSTAPSAVVGGKEINPGRKHANHRFIGPGYSIAHPGIFPHNKKAQAYTIEGLAAVRLARRLGYPRLRGQDCRRQDQGRLSQTLGRCARPRRCPADHRRESREAR